MASWHLCKHNVNNGLFVGRRSSFDFVQIVQWYIFSMWKRRKRTKRTAAYTWKTTAVTAENSSVQRWRRDGQYKRTWKQQRGVQKAATYMKSGKEGGEKLHFLLFATCYLPVLLLSFIYFHAYHALFRVLFLLYIFCTEVNEARKRRDKPLVDVRLVGVKYMIVRHHESCYDDESGAAWRKRGVAWRRESEKRQAAYRGGSSCRRQALFRDGAFWYSSVHGVTAAAWRVMACLVAAPWKARRSSVQACTFNVTALFRTACTSCHLLPCCRSITIVPVHAGTWSVSYLVAKPAVWPLLPSCQLIKPVAVLLPLLPFFSTIASFSTLQLYFFLL